MRSLFSKNIWVILLFSSNIGKSSILVNSDDHLTSVLSDWGKYFRFWSNIYWNKTTWSLEGGTLTKRGLFNTVSKHAVSHKHKCSFDIKQAAITVLGTFLNKDGRTHRGDCGIVNIFVQVLLSLCLVHIFLLETLNKAYGDNYDHPQSH